MLKGGHWGYKVARLQGCKVTRLQGCALVRPHHGGSFIFDRVHWIIIFFRKIGRSINLTKMSVFCRKRQIQPQPCNPATLQPCNPKKLITNYFLGQTAWAAGWECPSLVKLG